jgi:catechol 2,3-dioxygenase-like lactoylglutathione lyase family enzyme
MKLLTFDDGTGPRAGVLVDGDVVDAAALLGSAVTLRDVRAVLEFSDSAVERLQDAIGRVSAPRVPLTKVTLCAPILQPPTVRDHIAFEEHASGRGEGPDHHVLTLHESEDAGLDHFALEVAHPDDIERPADVLFSQGVQIVTPPTRDLEPGVKGRFDSRTPTATWWS